MVTLAVDAMGGDQGPRITVPAVLQALSARQDLRVLLFGRQQEIAAAIDSAPYPSSDRLQIIHADDVIGTAESPSLALRAKKQSSMRLMLDALDEGRVDACVSAGNTGALMAISRHVLKMSDGIERPAIVSALPRRDGRHTFILDLGANVGCDSEQLHQFARMGRAVARVLDSLENPRIALLNIGSEDSKGNDQVKLAQELIRADSQLNYVGFVEGTDLFSDRADVVVCDGFVGNVALKTVEGLARFILAEIRSTFSSDWFGRLLAWLIRPYWRRIEGRINPGHYNGAALIGLRGVVVKSHGNAGEAEFMQAMLLAARYAEKKLPEQIEQEL
ncbi:MAG TPA: phosphate acyltransferase PlsX [Dongiaceae bacterium]|nr:phosphate acyltransferase PlsX [Dongiaceae bacterium]